MIIPFQALRVVVCREKKSIVKREPTEGIKCCTRWVIELGSSSTVDVDSTQTIESGHP